VPTNVANGDPHSHPAHADGEFRLRSEDALRLWSDEAGEWLPASEGDLAELAVGEAERNRFEEE